MTIAPTLFLKVTADPTVSGLIDTRVVPEYDRQADKVYPLAVYKVENTVTQMASSGPTGLVSSDYVIAAIGQTYAAASQLADAIETALNGQTWLDAVNAINIQGCFLADDGRRDDMVTNPDNESINLYIVELTFNVWSNSTN